MSRNTPKPKTNSKGEVVHAVNVRGVVRADWKRWVRMVLNADEHIGPELTQLIRADIERRSKKGEE